MNGRETIQKITAECARMLLGVVFIFSGTVKAIDPVGGAIKIDDYLVAFHLEFLKIFYLTRLFGFLHSLFPYHIAQNLPLLEEK